MVAHVVLQGWVWSEAAALGWSKSKKDPIAEEEKQQWLCGGRKLGYKEVTDLTTFIELLSMDCSVLFSSACSQTEGFANFLKACGGKCETSGCPAQPLWPRK